uniref:Uncharacterized protein n=1 Tax=Myotis myotis TaxID=51298 RepID=A0A7J7RCS0_MYOMY|nr:hypothetical protein mMyoMyo1_010827 [Myotis myotis]
MPAHGEPSKSTSEHCIHPRFLQDVLSTAVSTSPAPHSPGTRAVTRAWVPAGRRQPISASPGSPSWHRHAGTCAGEGLSPLPSTTSFPSKDNSAAAPWRADRGAPGPSSPVVPSVKGWLLRQGRQWLEGHLQKCLKMFFNLLFLRNQ